MGILRFIDSAKSSTTKQMVHWWILGGKPFQLTQKTTEKWTFEGMPIVWRWSTLQHFQDSVLGHVYAGLRRCRRDRKRAAAKRGHHPFFFLVREKGGSSAPSEPPLATCLLCLSFSLCISLSLFFCLSVSLSLSLSVCLSLPLSLSLSLSLSLFVFLCLSVSPSFFFSVLQKKEKKIFCPSNVDRCQHHWCLVEKLG